MYIKKSIAKKVITKDSFNNDNGFLIELKKEGNKTANYLTVANPGCFKGYHLHKERAANYVCISGEVEVIMYYFENDKVLKEVVCLKQGDSLHIPKMIATALNNNSDKEVWIVNSPDPFYNPDYKDEQVEFTEIQCENECLYNFFVKNKDLL
jgi:dTDP-4-dehydrorhamnose 3,5-epimerase-like enzyme